MLEAIPVTKNLLAINSYFYRRGGSESLLMEHDALFRANGWDTAVFCMRHPDNLESPWERYFVDELEFGKDYPIAQRLKMATKVIYSFEARSKLGHLLDEFRPSVAHAHNIYHHISPSVLSLLRDRGVPTVLTAHDLKLACPAYKMFNRHGVCERCKNGNFLHVVHNRCVHGSLAASSLVAVESALHKMLGLYRNNLERIVVPSRFYLEKLRQWGWNARQMVFIPNYVKSESFDPKYAAGSYFLFFGRLSREKGVHTLIEAARIANVPLRIVGSGPQEAEIAELASRIGNVQLLGRLGGQALWDAVRGARAVVLPSEWFENAPMSILEAYSSGKPVIGARIGGIPEMVVEGLTGLLFESGDADGLACCLTQLADASDDKVAQMGRAAREHVTTHFTQERYLDEMLSLYDSVIR